MSTLYRPNHRFEGPQESQKHLISGAVASGGLEMNRRTLQESYAYWDGMWANRMRNSQASVRCRARIVDWYGPTGSHLSQLPISIMAEDRRLVVLPASSKQAAIQAMAEADALAVGIGSIPADFDSSFILGLIGRTPLIIGRLLLPYLEPVWDELGVFEAADEGSPGPLRAYGLEPEINSGEQAPTNSMIPDDGLGGRIAPIVAGSGAHRFYALLGNETLVLSLGIGTPPGGTTDQERLWVSRLLERWLAPMPETVTSSWRIYDESEAV